MTRLNRYESLEPLLLTVEEAAHVLSVGRSVVYDLIREGKLKSIKLGKSRRISVEACREFAHDQKNVS